MGIISYNSVLVNTYGDVRTIIWKTAVDSLDEINSHTLLTIHALLALNKIKCTAFFLYIFLKKLQYICFLCTKLTNMFLVIVAIHHKYPYGDIVLQLVSLSDPWYL